MRCAVIDIGTNTVKVLVADVQQGQAVPIMHKDRVTRLGEGVNEHECLSAAAIARTLLAIDDFHEEAKGLGATHIIALTTSACRDATNHNEFFVAVRQKCGLEVQLISGGREAELIFCGVSSDPEWTSAPLLVVDVGGGSAEFIQGCGGKMELFRSLPLGALRLTEQFGEGRLAELRQHVRSVLGPALAGYKLGGGRMVGTGGTITTLARMEQGAVDHVTITREMLVGLVRRLEAMPLAERKKVPGLPPDRADIIVAGGAVFLVAMELLGADELTVSVRNLRYGALLADLTYGNIVLVIGGIAEQIALVRLMKVALNPMGMATEVRTRAEHVGMRIINTVDVLRELGAFAVITLGVTLTKFNASKRVVHPLIFTQIWNAGVRLFPMIGFIGAALGVVIVGQTVSLLSRVGAQQYIGTVMVTVIVRELGPLTTALIVLARAGTSNVVELGTMRALGEIEALESLGVDPVHYLVMPRVIGLATAVFCLTTYLVLIAIAGGYLFAFLEDVPLTLTDYLGQLGNSLRWEDFALFALKTTLFGVVIAVVNCYHGLARPLNVEDVSQVTARAVVESVTACVLLDAFFLLVYLMW